MKIIKTIPKESLYFEESVVAEGNIDSISETGIINDGVSGSSVLR